MQAERRNVIAAACRLSFTAFCRRALPSYEHPPHLALIDAALHQVARYVETNGVEGIGRLAIELPPRHGKSVKAARLFPAWLMGRNPDLRVILASHTAALSEDHSRFVRNLIRDPRYAAIFPDARLADDSQARASWDMAEPHRGGLVAIGVDGAIHGRGGKLIVADDLVRSLEAYQSEAARDKLWDWFSTDLLSRQEPKAAIIMIGTRFGLDDPLGRLELYEGQRWTRIRLPALAMEDDPLGREVGEALWPERFDASALEAQRESMGDYSFSALYQQDPVAASGGIFRRDRFQMLDTLPADSMSKVRYWDLALSSKTTADYTVGTLLGQTTDKRLIVEDVARFQVDIGHLVNRIAEVAHADGEKVVIYVEAAFFHGTFVQDLIKRSDMHGYAIRAVKPMTDKVSRALPFAARVDAQRVWVLQRAWTRDWLDELCSFPGGKHDDQVDSVSGAYTALGQRQLPKTEIRGYFRDLMPANTYAPDDEAADRQWRRDTGKQ